MRKVHFGIATLCIACFLTPASAGPITGFTATSGFAVQEDFSTLSSGVFSGIFDAGNGVKAAESFVGQTITDPGGSGFETFNGTPSNPLTMAIPSASDGIYGISGGSAGLAGGSGGSDIGEGVVSLLFAGDLLEVGFRVFGVDSTGSMTVGFFARDGSIVDTVTLAPANTDFKFTSSGPVFAGISISNTDPEGIAYDDIRFDPNATVVPEPSSLALLAMGTVSLLGYNWRRKRNPAA